MTLSPEQADTLFEDIVNSFQGGKHEDAMRLAVSAYEQGMDEPLVLLLAAEAFDARGRGAEGVELLRRAARSAPGEAEVWHCLGTLLIRQGQEEEGVAHLKRALSLNPDLLPTLVNIAAACYRLGHLTDARTYYRRVRAIDPDNAEAVAALSAIAAREHRAADARTLAARALALQPGNFTAEMAMGRADLIDRQPEQVVTRMDLLRDRPDLDDDAQIAILDLRAEALDLLDRAGAAFADYKARNAILLKQFTPRMEREVAERYVDRARRLARSLAARPRSAWSDTPGPDEVGAKMGVRHAFLLSFPRSGTTLLEKVLSAHSQVLALEEVDLLSECAGEWLDSDAGLDLLARLPAEQAAHHRARYWERAQEAAGAELGGKMLLDKLPLHTLSLPVISRLFPDAKVLFAVRDPRDVVFSAFRRRFMVNPAMFELLDLQGAADFYDAVMNLAEACRALLPNAVYEVRHEQVVQSFEPRIRSVLDFVGLDWEPGLTEFARNLPADPHTPSDVQLRSGLNADGLGQWRRYRNQMEPVMETLERWVQHFGYE